MAAKDAAILGARVGAGLIGGAIAVVAFGAALFVHAPGTSASVTPVSVAPTPTAAVVACAGPLLSPDSTISATALSSFAPATTTVADQGLGAAATPLGEPDDARAGSAGAPASYTLPAQQGATTAPPLAAAQSQFAGLSELKGLAASDCGQPVSDAWISAGSSDLGQNSLLLLANPGGTAATVDVQVYTEQGLLAQPGSRGIVVQPHAVKVVPLAGIAPSAIATVLHVTATGAAVVPSLQQSYITGITPQGVDLIGTTVAPSPHLVVPGVVFAAGSQGHGGGDSVDASMPVLRVLPTGSGAVSLNIAIAGDQGSFRTSLTQTVTGGQVSEVPLPTVPQGSFTVTVDAQSPVVASVRTATSGTSGTDFAWYAAAPQLSGQTALSVAAGPGGQLHLANPGTDAATVTVTATGGQPVTLKVPAGGSAAKSLPSGAYLLGGTDGLYAAVSLSGAGQLAGYPLQPPGVNAQPVTVYVK